MALLLNAALGALLAGVALVTLMLGVTAHRLRGLKWQAMRSGSVAREEIPAGSRAILESVSGDLAELGFSYRTSGTLSKAWVSPDVTPDFFDVYQHADGHTHALVSPSPVPEKDQPCMVQLITCLADGNNWVTRNRLRHCSPMVMPRWQVFDDYLPEWKLAWLRHLARVRNAGTALCTDGVEVQRRVHHSFEQMIPQMAQQGQLQPIAQSGQFRLTWLAALRIAGAVVVGHARAAWAVRALPRRQTAATTQHAGSPAAVSEQGMEAEVLAFQTQRAMRKSTGLGTRGKRVLFAVTALLFMAVGVIWLPWYFAAMVLAVVAIHEGGHYLAMKLTGYRNVSVFFLPGLGGLATGEKATATPFEKLFVYLAGPVPGIALAGLAYWAASAGQWSMAAWLYPFLLVSLFINYLNLLPIVPLDGGRVLETLLFGRVPMFRFGFVVICCAVLLALGVALQDLVLSALGALVAFGLPHHWRVMRLDRTIRRPSDAGLDEPQAIRLIFAGLQHQAFHNWSFAKRSAAATALLPELMGRRANTLEAMVGLLIYATVLVAPVAAIIIAVPESVHLIWPMDPMPQVAADEVDLEPALSKAQPLTDWNAKLARSANLSPTELLQTYLGAASRANDVGEVETARRHYKAAWGLAQNLPLRDLRRIDVLTGLASVTDQVSERVGYLNQIVSELGEPQGEERLRVAQSKEQLSYLQDDTAIRVKLLQEAVELRTAASPPNDERLQHTLLFLARALDANADAAQAEAMLRQRTERVSMPPATDRTRRALDDRVRRVMTHVDLAWFLMAHDRLAEAQPVAAQALTEVPAKVTRSWVEPQQRVLEASLWAELLSGRTTSLLAQWNAYEAEFRGGYGWGNKLLFLEADRALVAQTLQDARMLARAKSNIESITKTSRRQPSLCTPRVFGNGQANWRQPQQDARQRVLTELGACRPA